MFLRAVLLRLGRFQAKHYSALTIAALIFTAIMLLGVPQMRLQTDLNKELPSGIEVIEKMKEVGEKFGSSDSIVIIVQLDRDSDSPNRVTDIRDPRVLSMVAELHKTLEEEREISSVFSHYIIYSRIGIPETLEESRKFLELIPQLKDFYSRDYTATVLYAYSDIGSDEKRNRALVDAVREDIENLEKPAGVKILLTGNPLMRVTLFELLIRDAAFTLSIAAIIILILLILTQGSLLKGFVVFLPLSLSVVWTLGTMGWLDIPLSIGTVGVGAMILGLGVEYGVFVMKRYEEEKRKGRTPEEILSVIVPGVGLNITGSASTTIAGFLALLLATMPMIQKMGATLALGIFYSYIAAVVVNPAIITFFDRRGSL
jgi:hypothetical protein